MADATNKARSLEETPTWAVAVVCFVLLVISIFIEHAIHILGKGKVALVSAYGIHQLHIFIFVLAVSHILYCILTYALGRTKMRKWKVWENETKTIEYQYYNDPERFRFTRDTSFGKRHLNCWSRSTLSLWIMCFFRQFFGSVTKVDYMTLRHGFIVAHLAHGNETKFDFQKYIKRSLEEDFKVVVGISPIIWFTAVLFLLAYTSGWYSYFWLPFIPLVIILMVGTKLQVIITEMGLRIEDRGGVVKGAPLVQPGDDLFWFGRPRFLLFIIHLVLFTYEFSLRSCYHEKLEDIIIRISMGLIIQFLCSYVTLPLYALVTQMGTNMRSTIFNERVAAALKNWHQTAKKHTKQSNKQSHSQSMTPYSSRPATPTHGMSPVHLLHNYPRSVGSYPTSPRHSNIENDQWELDSTHSPTHHVDHRSLQLEKREVDKTVEECSSSQIVAEAQTTRTQHEIGINLSDFSFAKK
ncbi:MLO-like protein 6 [Hibiscus syriacus]|uniref:MLO-like protein n=1 Tax=Hibiscus syriacus TaxID=106335 RepID=A0A6A3C3B3_HIBSY|nr:MLO-like protein 6 [Hibiscus syriacus]